MNRQEIIGLFKKRDQKDLYVPEDVRLEDLGGDFKLATWIHRSHHLGYIVENLTGHMRATAFKRPKPLDSAFICTQCLVQNAKGKTCLFTVGKGTKTYGQHMCSDLDCVSRMRNDAMNPHSTRENMPVQQRIDRYLTNLSAMLDQAYAIIGA